MDLETNNHQQKSLVISKVLLKYYINTCTSAIMTYFHNGGEYSRVIEGQEFFYVSQSPEEIVEQSFNEIGSSIKGARKAAKQLLQKSYKLPVVLSAAKNITLISIMSADKKSCIWFIASHILDTQPHNDNQTKVYLKGGHCVTVDIKRKSLQVKRAQASFLHISMLENSELNEEKNALYKQETGLLFIKEDGHYNFTMISREKYKPEVEEKTVCKESDDKKGKS